ncbi:MAG: tetratricopeptide repeat protein [Gammaproteobacteria bacterium]|nr:tetratricopeptide repeat protein [Gammaproteobacteria bacterium]MDH3767655.1 tetratricopeptide repeat protein [Gammaproteobacteria bacterium]
MRLLVLIFSVAIAGCATTAQHATDSDYSDLYAGRSPVVFATKLPADSASAAITLGDQAYRSGKLDQALFHYLQSIKLDDSKAVGFYRIGLVHRQRGNLQLALRAFGHVLERDDRHVGALEELGLISLKEHELDSASRYFDRVLAVDSDRARAHNGLGVISDLNGHHKLAADRFRRALELQPNAIHIVNNLGYSLYLSGNWDEAEEKFAQALRLDPKHELATHNLALLQVRRGQHEKALHLLAQVTSEAVANNDLGYLCMLDGQHNAAERFFRAAIELSPTYYEMAHRNLDKNRTLAQSINPRLTRVLSPAPTPVTAVSAPLKQVIESEPMPTYRQKPAAVRLAETRSSTPRSNPITAEPTASDRDNLYLKRYVTANSLNVRDDSSESGSVTDKIRRGRVVRVLQESGDWAYILYWRYHNDGVLPRRGWVHASFLTEVLVRA